MNAYFRFCIIHFINKYIQKIIFKYLSVEIYSKFHVSSSFRYHMYLKTPSQDSSWTTYLQPFTTGMLIVTLLSILCCAVIISIPYYTAHWIKSNTKEEQQFSIGNSLIVTLGAFFQQGEVYFLILIFKINFR